jgi:hypothetical protein
MALTYDTTALVEKAKIRAVLPDDDNDVIIEHMGDVLQSYIAPLIKSLNQEYMVTILDYPYVQSQSAYDIPTKAMANSLRDIMFVDQSGREISIPYLNPDILKQATFMFGYYFQGDQVIIRTGSGIPNFTYPTLRMKYHRRPNMLVPTDECAQITSVLGNVATVSSVPSTWTIATTVDIVKSMPNFTLRGEDLIITDITGINITFSSLPATVIAGDWISEAGTSPIAMIPLEALPLLMEMTASEMLEMLGDPKYKTSEANAAKLEAKLTRIMAPRVDGSVKTLSSFESIFDTGF